MAIHKCPVCAGKGKMHYSFYPDAPEPTTAASTNWVTCRSCHGAGVVSDEALKKNDSSSHVEHLHGPEQRGPGH